MTSGGSEEIRQLVRSLDDLEAEFEVGDLEGDDYQTLKDDYTVRVADAVRHADRGEAGRRDRGPDLEVPGGRRLVVALGLLVFALGAGWLLARSAGERGLGDALTGSIDQSARQRVTGCQELGIDDGQLLEAIRCFDDVLTTDPDNVEALTYRAWFLVLASGGGDETTVDQQVELLAAAEVYLDRAIELEPEYPDARAFRAVVADRQGRSAETCTQLDALIELEPPPFFIEQTKAIADRNGC